MTHASPLSHPSPSHTLPLTPLPPLLQTHEAETVYSFGHMLYEMTSGQNLTSALLEDHCLTNIAQVHHTTSHG